MERLTFDGLFCDIAKCDSTPGGTFCESGTCTQRRVWERLKEYEDTGLEPKYIKEFRELCTDEVVELARILHKAMESGEVDHIRELLQAEQDGRLVVLPCKVGDTVFDIGDGTSYATRVLNFSYFGDYWACRTVSSYPDLEQFGTRIFLTREEAEAALKGASE